MRRRHLRRRKLFRGGPEPAGRAPGDAEADARLSLFAPVDDGEEVSSDALDRSIAEALAEWRRPAAGLSSPTAFSPAAVETAAGPGPVSEPFSAIGLPAGLAQLDGVRDLRDVVALWRVFDESSPAPCEPAASQYVLPPPPQLPPPPLQPPPP